MIFFKEEEMHEKSIEILNKAVAEEITALHQYMYFHFHCDDQGFDLLAGLFKKTAIEEMLHVERMAERILFLGGDVVMEPSEKVIPEKDVAKMLSMSKKMEEESAIMYNKMAVECGNNADSVTKTLFEELVVDEERHYDQYDDEIENLERFGERYLVLQSMERSKMRGSNQPAE
jgi:bacterioferritin